MPPERLVGQAGAYFSKPTSSRNVLAVPKGFECPSMRGPKATFSRTDIQGKRECCWKTMPQPGLGPLIGAPSIVIDPSVCLSIPAMTFSSVDFPQPEGPSSARNSPDRISTSNFSSAVTGPAFPANVTARLLPSMRPGRSFCCFGKLRCAAVTIFRLEVPNAKARILAPSRIRQARGFHCSHCTARHIVDRPTTNCISSREDCRILSFAHNR